MPYTADDILKMSKGASTKEKPKRLTVKDVLAMAGQAIVKPIQEVATISATPYMLLPESVKQALPPGTVPTPEQVQQDLPGAVGTAASFLPAGAVGQMAKSAGLGRIGTTAAQGLAAGTAMGGARAAVAGEPLPQIAEEAGKSGLLGAALGAAGGKVASKFETKVAQAVANKNVAPGSDEELIVRLTEGLKSAVPVRIRQAELDAAERAARLENAQAARVGVGGGEQGFYAAKSRLAGELPIAEWEGLRPLFTQEEVDRLFNLAATSPKVKGWGEINAQEALMKLLKLGTKRSPTPKEQEILQEVFGPDLVKAALEARSTLEKVGEKALEVLNIPRSLMASADLSAAGRQAMPMMGNPAYWKALPRMIQAFGSEKVYQASLERIKAMPTYAAMRKAGLSITEAGTSVPLSNREEQFATNLAERFGFGAGKVIHASNRAFVTMLNEARANYFNSVYQIAQKSGAAENPFFQESLANMANILTGRGNLGKLNGASRALNAVFFAPRFWYSRLQILNPATYATAHPIVRREALKTIASTAAIQAATLGLAKVALGDRASVEMDPRSSDFLKFRIGNTRFDPLSGVQQPIRVLSQVLSGGTKDTVTGRVKKLAWGKKGFGRSREDVLEQWVEGKTQPVASLIISILRGTSFGGKKLDMGKEVVERMTPLLAQDVHDALYEWGPEGLAVLPFAAFGVGTQTYVKNEGWRSERGAEYRAFEDRVRKAIRGQATAVADELRTK